MHAPRAASRLLLLAASLLLGCASTSGDEAGKEGPFGTVSYFEALHDGRLYVTGSEASHNKVLQTGHLPYTHTLIGAGPRGETVVVEVDKDDPEHARRLIDEYADRHPYYAEVQHEGRTYVLGSLETHDSFLSHHHLPYTRTLIGAAADGGTLVIEIDKDHPELAQRLAAEYAERHGAKLD